jgi:3-deoxy-manno-octulosonate cytidylyltransferase (CMP-KDO synthetase)
LLRRHSEPKGSDVRCAIIIPARAGSSRFVGKPLALLCGQSLILRTWRIAHAVPGVADVVVATDDNAIAQHVQQFGGRAMMTPPARNGSERAAYVARHLAITPDVVVNLQGDAVLTPPGAIEQALKAMDCQDGDAPQICTVGVPLLGPNYDRYLALKASGRASGTTVVTNLAGDAMYFSKCTLPHLRQAPDTGPKAWRHLGLYAYRYKALQTYAALSPTPLEDIEGLEQLRWLEHGHPMRVVPYDLAGRSVWSIDYPEDIAIAQDIIARESELLCASS